MIRRYEKQLYITYTPDQIFKYFSVNDIEEINNIINNFTTRNIIGSIFCNQTNLNVNNIYYFKNSNNFSFYNNLFSNIKVSINDFYSIRTMKILLLHVGSTNKGQYIFNKIPYKEMIKKISDNEKLLIDLYFNIGVSGTLPTFLLIDKLITKKNILNGNMSILSAACRNSDIRILKYIINNFDTYQFPYDNNKKFISYIIYQIYSQHIPPKYILKRLKIVNSKINLKPFFDIMVECTQDIKVFEKIYKFYKPNGSIYKKYNNIKLYSYNINNVTQILDILENKKDKYIYLLNEFIVSNNQFLKNINISDYFYEEFYKDSYITNLHKKFIETTIYNYTSISSFYKSNFITNFKHIFSNINFNINILNTTHSLVAKIFILPFYTFTNTKNYISIKMNFVKFILKVWLRKRNKILRIMKRIELINNNLTKFSNVSPKHCMPFELEKLSSNKDGMYIISEKVDGCMIDFVSNTVEPVIPEYISTNIKAEFIEDLDLYLIFDYNVDKHILDRYDNIRKLHMFTTNSKPIRENIINNFDELKLAIKDERIRFKSFLKMPYKNYRIYPKARWLVKNANIINKELIFNIIEEDDCNFICNEGMYKNDGVIITPLDNSIELKIKPKSQHTIDLIYIDGWKDKEGHLWNHIIKTKNKYKNNMIMKCKPTFTKENNYWMFKPVEYRFDKAEPNTNKTIKIIYELHSINWKNIYSNNNYVL